MRFIYLVDNDALVRRSVTVLLRGKHDLVVQGFRSGAAFLESADALDPGVLLLELQMPGVGGVDIIEALQATNEGRFVTVVLTGTEAIPLVVRAMKAGAADLVTKPYRERVLLDALDAAFVTLDARRAEVLVGDAARQKIAHLSSRERDVLKGLVDGRANKMIASDLDISPRTVEIYRANLMRKLGVRSLAEGIKLAFAAQWGFEEESPIIAATPAPDGYRPAPALPERSGRPPAAKWPPLQVAAAG